MFWCFPPLSYGTYVGNGIGHNGSIHNEDEQTEDQPPCFESGPTSIFEKSDDVIYVPSQQYYVHVNDSAESLDSLTDEQTSNTQRLYDQMNAVRTLNPEPEYEIIFQTSTTNGNSVAEPHLNG